MAVSHLSGCPKERVEKFTRTRLSKTGERETVTTERCVDCGQANSKKRKAGDEG